MAIEVKVPDIGDFKDVPVIEIHVKVGDAIKADDPLVSLESDKATMDVPAPQDGTVEAILVKVGDKVAEGTPVLTLQAAAGDAPVTPPPSVIAQQEPAPAPKPTSAPPAQPARAAAEAAGTGLAHASPSVRRLARELEVDLAKLKGTGEKGRITKDDVKAFLRGPAAPAAGAAAPAGGPMGGMGIPEIPAQDFAKFGPIETRPMARIKRISGPFLHRAWLNIPHVTHGDEADVTELEAYRKQLDDAAKADKKSPYRVSLLPFLMKASVSALRAFPEFNSSLSPEKDALILKKYYNIGVAVDTPDALVVPVIKDADRKGIHEISKDMGTI